MVWTSGHIYPIKRHTQRYGTVMPGMPGIAQLYLIWFSNLTYCLFQMMYICLNLLKIISCVKSDDGIAWISSSCFNLKKKLSNRP